MTDAAAPRPTVGDALEAELAKLDPEERRLLDEIHDLRGKLHVAQLQLTALRAAKKGPA